MHVFCAFTRSIQVLIMDSDSDVEIIEHPTVEEVGRMNMEALWESFKDAPDIKSFLHNQDMIVPLVATPVYNPRMTLDLQCDYNGVVVELKKLGQLRLPFSKLPLTSFRKDQLKMCWQLIKKHVDRKNMSAEGLATLKKIKGVTFLDLNDGYKLTLYVIPKSLVVVEKVFTVGMQNYLPEETLTIINGVLINFVILLQGLPKKEYCRPTLARTILVNKGYMNVLPQDQEFVLSMLDRASDRVGDHPRLKLCYIVHRFRQKDPTPLNLTDISPIENIKRVSLHIGANMTPRDPNTTLFWARAGIQRLVGQRTNMYSCMSMHECVNFQTSIDQGDPDVSTQIKRLCKLGEPSFWQMYVDRPYLHSSSFTRHPVSGVIATIGLNGHQYQESLERRAEDFIRHMEDMVRKTPSPYALRVEMVIPLERELVNYDVPIPPSAHYDIWSLQTLLHREPMVVPFCWVDGTRSVNDILGICLREMVDHLRALGIAHNAKGGHDAAWESFQLELSLEETLYGHPLNPVDMAYSASLGTSSLHKFSLTHYRGFMALDNHNSVSVPNQPPPLGHWTKDAQQAERIKRLFPLTCMYDCQPVVIGPELVMVLVKDLYRRNDRIPLAEMQGEQCPGTLKGHINLSTLTQHLSSRQSFPLPFTFGRARTLLAIEGKDVLHCLRAGFCELKIKYFPDLMFRDVSGNNKATWNFKDWIEVHDDDSEPSIQSRAISLVGDVAQEMERRGLCYARTLERYREHGMPWLPQVMQRLPPNLVNRLTVLVFTSAIGILMNNDFVSFDKIKDVIVDMGVTQADLQKWTVLSSSTWPRSYGFNLYKLHYQIDYYMVAPAPQDPKDTARARPVHQEEQQEVAVPTLEPFEESITLRSEAKYLPANTTARWTDHELMLIDRDPNTAPGKAYKDYLKNCSEHSYTARSFRAFCHKRRELLN